MEDVDLICLALEIAEAATDWDNFNDNVFNHPDKQVEAMRKLRDQLENPDPNP